VNTQDKLLDRILAVAACIKKSEYQLGRRIRDLRTRGAKYFEDEVGIFAIYCEL